MQLIVICAWCKKFMGFKEWEGSNPPKLPVSHSICPDCKRAFDDEVNKIKGGDHERKCQTSIG